MGKDQVPTQVESLDPDTSTTTSENQNPTAASDTANDNAEKDRKKREIQNQSAVLKAIGDTKDFLHGKIEKLLGLFTNFSEQAKITAEQQKKATEDQTTKIADIRSFIENRETAEAKVRKETELLAAKNRLAEVQKMLDTLSGLTNSMNTLDTKKRTLEETREELSWFNFIQKRRIKKELADVEIERKSLMKQAAAATGSSGENIQSITQRLSQERADLEAKINPPATKQAA